MRVNRSLIYNRNWVSDRSYLWGTPGLTGYVLDAINSTITWLQFAIHSQNLVDVHMLEVYPEALGVNICSEIAVFFDGNRPYLREVRQQIASTESRSKTILSVYNGFFHYFWNYLHQSSWFLIHWKCLISLFWNPNVSLIFGKILLAKELENKFHRIVGSSGSIFLISGGIISVRRPYLREVHQECR